VRITSPVFPTAVAAAAPTAATLAFTPTQPQPATAATTQPAGEDAVQLLFLDLCSVRAVPGVFVQQPAAQRGHVRQRSLSEHTNIGARRIE
jgi:hypothetical protein